MNPTSYCVTEIRSKGGIYILGHPIEIHDEGSFYRVDGTYIFDKFRIKSMEISGKQLIFHMDDDDVVFTVKKKES